MSRISLVKWVQLQKIISHTRKKKFNVLYVKTQFQKVKNLEKKDPFK